MHTIKLTQRIAACLLLFLFCIPSYASAQEINASENLDNHIVLLGGYSPQSIRFLGKTPDSQTTFTYLGYRYRMRYRIFGMTTFYSAGIYPRLKYNYSKRDDGGRKDVARGFGISPIGFFMTHDLSKTFTWVFSSNGGIIYMDRFFPTDNARRLNYMFDLNTEIVVKLSPDFALSFGYKFHHISNAQTGKENPGLDSNILFFTIIL